MIIDSHHHYWHYNAVEYDWIDDAMANIRRDFLPSQLGLEIESAGVDGVVSVQARQTIAETEWLLQLANESPFMKGVVGWLPIIDKQFPAHLEKFAGNPKLKSIRHVVQGEPDNDFILRPDFNNGIRLLKDYGLAYDILILEKHLPQTIRFVDAHPNQLFVLDHIAKPLIGQNLLSPWRENFMELSKRPNVYCKLSGMVNEAGYKTWTPAQLKPYFDVVLEAFGSSRLLFGSDWPVCLVGVGYQQWFDVVKDAIKPLTPNEQKAILGDNALRVYNL
jgi:L-fuconolactonase